MTAGPSVIKLVVSETRPRGPVAEHPNKQAADG